MKKIIIAILLILFFVSGASATTDSFYRSSETQYYKTGTSYPPSTDSTMGGGSYYADKEYSSPNYSVICVDYAFDTSSLPDSCVISSANITVYISDISDNQSRNLVADEGSGWSATVGTTFINESVSGLSTGEKVFTLSNAANNINKTGTTHVRFAISGDAPTGKTYVALKNTAGGYSVYLSVTYTTGYTHEINGVSNSPEINGVSNPTEVNGI